MLMQWYPHSRKLVSLSFRRPIQLPSDEWVTTRAPLSSSVVFQVKEAGSAACNETRVALMQSDKSSGSHCKSTAV